MKDDRPIQKSPDGEYTIQAQEDILSVDTRDENATLPESLQEDPVSVFRRKLDERLKELGYAGSLNDGRAKLKFLEGKVAQHLWDPEHGLDERISRQDLENWLGLNDSRHKRPPIPGGKNSSRENVFKLCFALELSVEKEGEEKGVEDFFRKAYQHRPFNVKTTREAVYYFCLSTGKSYFDAQRLIAAVEAAPQTETPAPGMDTVRVEDELRGLSTEEELITYLASHRYDEFYTSVAREIAELYKNCRPLAQEEAKVRFESEAVPVTAWSEKEGKHVLVDDPKPIEVKGYASLLSVIYGDYQGMDVSNPALPLTENNLYRILGAEGKLWTGGPIKGGTSIQDDSIYRRALMLLTFYHTYAQHYLNERKVRRKQADEVALQGYANDFQGLLDHKLLGCGFAPLYEKNRDDSIFIYCAGFPDPLEEYRLQIEKRLHPDDEPQA